MIGRVEDFPTQERMDAVYGATPGGYFRRSTMTH